MELIWRGLVLTNGNYTFYSFICIRHIIRTTKRPSIREYLDATDPAVPITLIPANTTMPDGLCLIHKQCRNYCIETDRVCTLEDYNKQMKTLQDLLVQMNQTEFIKLNDQYWANVAMLPPVKPKGLYQYYDDR